MYLSRLILNPRNATVIRALSDLYSMHQLLWSAFPETFRHEDRDESGPALLLYRVENLSRDGLAKALVQSTIRPDWTELQRRPGILCAAESKDYSPRFATGQWLRYRLRANPTVCVNKPGWKRSKRVGLYGAKQDDIAKRPPREEWLRRQGNNWGFSLPTWQDIDGEEHVDTRTVSAGNLYGCKEYTDTEGNPRRREIRLFSVDYEGLLGVTDADRFQQAIERGIGPAKSFGFGLLSVVPAMMP